MTSAQSDGRADAGLRESVYDDAPVGLAHLDMQLRYLGINRMLAQMHGVPVARHLGRSIDEVLPPALAAEHVVHCRVVIARAAPVLDVCLRAESPQHDGATHDWLVSYFPLRDSTMRHCGVAMTVVDITRRRDAERRLQAERRVARILARTERLEDALPAALDAILESFELDFGEYWTPADGGGLVRAVLRSAQAADHRAADDLEAIPLAFGEGLIGQVAQTRQPIFIPDVKADPEFRRSVSASTLGLCTGFAFPVMVRETCVGVISLFSRRRLDIGPTLNSVLARLGQEIGQFAIRSDAQREAREYEARTRAVIESALDAVVSIDEAGRVLEWNPRAEEMFGWSRTEAVGRDLADTIIPPPMRAAHRAGMQRFLATGEGPVLNRRIEVTALHRDETQFPVELAVLPLELDNRFEFTAYLRDITERKRTEAALLEADRRKTEFLAILGHELRNPLATIANCVRLIEVGAEDTRELVRVMRPQIDQLRFLLDDLLDITRINHGKIALNRRVVDLSEVLRGAIDATQPLMAERGQTLLANLTPISDMEIFADSTRVQQIVSNLLTNASKYSPPDSTIQIDALRKGDRVEIAVRDDGMGIPADRLDDIFEAFTQIREAPTGTGGLGIGLTLVRLLTEMHGGTVSVRSDGPGCGSTFTVSLPAAIPVGAHDPAPVTQAAPSVGSNWHLLIVDDNEAAAATMGRLIQHATGCSVEVVYDGRSALAAVNRRVPDAMLVDIKLPDMSGLDIVAALRADPRFDATRLVALSGFGHEDAIRESLEAGFEAHIAKPVDLPEILQVLTATDT